ncbi:MAG: Na+/H+ antiporter [Chloroflexota bacterium]
MTDITLFVVLLFVVALLAVASRRIGVPYPILMVVAGLGLGLVPGLPRVELEPDLVFLFFLPPILFSAAYFTSFREFRANIRPISLLAIGLVLATTGAVALVVHSLEPQLGWAAAFVLGAIVSPPDAIAATAIAQRLGLPRRLVTIIEGESLVNDATALVAYRLGVVAVVTGAFALDHAILSFFYVAVAGIAVGVVAGFAVSYVIGRLHDPPVEVTISLLAPFATYLPAELIGASGVLATVTAGLMLGWYAPRVLTSDSRILGSAVWQMVIFLLNGLAFILIGLQLPSIAARLGGPQTQDVLGITAAVVVTVIAVRVLWAFPATYLPRLLVPGLAKRDPSPPPGAILVLGWTGMRGVVSLGAALALPRLTDAGAPFPGRDLILFITFAVILATLVGQGLTLPWVIRHSGVGDDGSISHEELHAREAANEAALDRLGRLTSEVPGHLELIDDLRRRYDHQTEHLVHDHEDGHVERTQEAIEHEKIRRAVIDAQRLAVIGLRDRGVIGDEALRRVERDLDLEELRMEA